MSLVRTLVASCNQAGCRRLEELDPDTTQPFNNLSQAGWVLDNDVEQGEIFTFCPDHRFCLAPAPAGTTRSKTTTCNKDRGHHGENHRDVHGTEWSV